MKSPYASRSARHFWKTGVSGQSAETISDLWMPKFSLVSGGGIATAGSCFAQHIARYLRDKGANVLDMERAPPGLSPANAAKYGYSIYSARYGNIYTVRHLLQLAQEAFGRITLPDIVWQRDGRFFDAMRPSVEPDGLPSIEAVRRHREQHLDRVKRLLVSADILVFTLGLTEAWVHKPSGTVYPTAPGTIAGSYDPEIHGFKNFDFAEVYGDFVAFRELVGKRNPSLKFLLTVSPVPLAATAEDRHVLVSTTYSKAVLRAVAGKLAADFDNVDYFPSFDLITSPCARGAFYDDGMRQVTEAGVAAAMKLFFDAQSGLPTEVRSDGDLQVATASASDQAEARRRRRARRQARLSPDSSQVVCEEVLLDAFSR